MIKIFAEFHGAKRCPCVSYAINGTEIMPHNVDHVGGNHHVRYLIVNLPVTDYQSHNVLTVTQIDKTDDDLSWVDDELIDHYVEIKEIEIEGVRLEPLLYKHGTFEHSMPDRWVTMMQERGIDIPKIYHQTTQLRLNGVWKLCFDHPVWQWHAEQLMRWHDQGRC